jgi:high-affinity iron transporter
VVLAPSTPPSKDRGQELFAQACTPCHGPRGAGDGAQGLKLDPRPRNFHDPIVMKDLSPARVFNALTDGVKGTAMASFASALPAADRWNLAYYVFTLRHDDDAIARGGTAFRETHGAIPSTAAKLAGLSDGELDAQLAAAGLDDAGRADALAWLRGAAPYATTIAAAPLDPARRLLADSLRAYHGGDHAGARRIVGTAYIDGFDPYEGALAARDAKIVPRVEDAFAALKEKMSSNAADGDVDQSAATLGKLLDAAEDTLGAGHAGGGRGVAFASALIIILREGVEAALLILLMLGLAHRAGAGADAKAVHIGWLLALGVGIATWMISGQLFAHLRGRHREIVEGATALLAAGVLLWAGHFVLARLDAKRRVDALKKRFSAVSPAQRRWVLASLGFIAVFREAFEVVLFLRTVELEYPAGRSAMAGGAAAGGALLVGFVLLMQKLGKRVKPGPLLTASGTLLCALAVILAGKGVRALQEADVLGQRRLGLPRVDWLGLFPTVQGVVAQLVVLGAFVAIAVVAVRRSRLA